MQKKKDNRQLALQRDQIADQRKEIMDSIHYAKHIQYAVMHDPTLNHEIISDHFLFFRPRDIVSGDFYWATRRGNKSVVVAADCTGHGVPGAFLSMLGISFLNEIVLKLGVVIASKIIDELRYNIKTIMSRTNAYGEQRDGMDMALCIIDYDTMKLQYSGAYNPLYIVRNGELIEYTADKMPVGIHLYVDEEKKFTNHEISLQNDDMLYMFTDGFIDQFGGTRDTKFKSRPFEQLLTKIATLPTEEQKDILTLTHDQWKGTGYKVDDILVIGIRIHEPHKDRG
jgi:serine phosphatase RsbU (regulator of sigma subunit)